MSKPFVALLPLPFPDPLELTRRNPQRIRRINSAYVPTFYLVDQPKSISLFSVQCNRPFFHAPILKGTFLLW
jgi:hypothetical protein